MLAAAYSLKLLIYSEKCQNMQMKLSENENMENILPGSLFGGYTLLKTVAFLFGFILWTVVPSRRVCLIIILVCILDTSSWFKCQNCQIEFK